MMIPSLVHVAFFYSLLYKSVDGVLPGAGVPGPLCLTDLPQREEFVADCREMLKRLRYTNLPYSTYHWNPNLTNQLVPIFKYQQRTSMRTASCVFDMRFEMHVPGVLESA